MRFKRSDFPEMAFGAIVGFADLVDCVWAHRWKGTVRAPIWAREKYPWLERHWHAEGPVCWILDRVRRLGEPIPYRGRQRLFDIPDDILKGRR